MDEQDSELNIERFMSNTGRLSREEVVEDGLDSSTGVAVGAGDAPVGVAGGDDGGAYLEEAGNREDGRFSMANGASGSSVHEEVSDLSSDRARSGVDGLDRVEHEWRTD